MSTASPFFAVMHICWLKLYGVRKRMQTHCSTYLLTPCCATGSDYRKQRAAIAQLVLLLALALFYCIGWGVSKALSASPHTAYPLTVLAASLITRFR